MLLTFTPLRIRNCAVSLLSLCFAAQSALAQGVWTGVAPMPTRRADLAVVTGADGRLYAINGRTANGAPSLALRLMEIYNPAANSWVTGAAPLGGHYGGRAALGHDGRIYLMGGYLQDSSVEAYDPATGTWSARASMITGRFGFAAVTGLDGLIYTFGGDTSGGGQNVNVTEAYNPTTNTWTSRAPIPRIRAGLGAAVGPDGRIYLIGGYTSDPSQSTYVSIVDVYNPVTNAWSTAPSLPTPRNALAVVADANNLLYAVGGQNGSGTLNTVEAYSVSLNSWQTVAPMPTARFSLGAAQSSSGIIFAIGGIDAAGNFGIVTNEALTPTGTALQSQTIIFSPLSGVTYGVAPFTIAATASSGLAVSFTSTTTTVCTISGNTVTLLSPGTCSITATQPGNSSYSAAPSVTQSFTVGVPTPTISGLTPSSAGAGGPAFVLTINGTGLVQASQVQWNGTALSTSYGSATQLTASVPASLIANAGTASITVANPGGAVSNSAQFTIGALTISTLTPNAAVAGGSAFALTVNGTGFVATSQVQWNGTTLSTSYGSTTQLTASVPASLIANAGTASITVANPGGAVSNSAQFTIGALTISTQTPNAAVAGGSAFALTVNGTGFVATSQVQWNGTTLSTSYGSATQLTASVPASLIANAGTANITVSNPGGAVSNTLVFAIAGLNITTSTLPSGIVGTAYSQTLTAVGGTPPYSNWVLSSGMMPPGLTLNASTGTISGVPTAAGGSPFNFGVIVKDSTGANSAPQTLSIAISEPSALTIITASPLPPGTVGVPYSQPITGTSGVAPYRNWVVTSGVVPPGTLFTSTSNFLTGLLSGTPTTAGTYTFTVQVVDSASATATKQFNLTINPAGTLSIYPTGIVNAASYAGGGVAPGEIVAIFGSGIGPNTLTNLQVGANGILATSLAGFQVLFDGTPAALIYVSSTQVSAVVPYEVSGKASTQVQVVYQGQASNAVSVPVTTSAPGIFSLSASGAGPGATLNQDNTVNSANNPAAPGSAIVLYATGEGQTDPPGVDGKLATTPLPAPVQAVTATVGGVNAKILYAGAAPTLVAGVIQVNLQLPQGVTAGNAVPVTLNVGGANSQTGVTVAIANTLGMVAAQIQSLTLSTGSVAGGSSVTGTVVLSSAASAGGAGITLSSSSSAASVPAVVTVMAGSTSATFSITTAVVSSNQSVTITASYGGASKQAILTLTAGSGLSSGVTITAISNKSPLPFSPLTINTTGINPSNPVDVKFTDNAGYTITTPAVIVSATGVVIVATPLYVNTSSGQIGPGVLFVTVSQGSATSSPVSINILDVPPLSTYGTTLGTISHAVLVFDAMLIGQRINQLQAFQSLPANTIDTSDAQTSLKTLLNAVIQERSDVDNVTLNNSLVIAGGSLPNGTAMQFDRNSLDMMDRIHALFLTQTFTTIQSSIGSNTIGSLPQLRATRVSRRKIPKDTLTGLPSPFAPPAGMFLSRQFGATTNRRAVKQRAKPETSSSGTLLQTLLKTMTTFSGTVDLATGTQKSQGATCQGSASEDCWINQVQANAQVMSGTTSLLDGLGAIPEATKLESQAIGGVAAVLQDGQVVLDVFGQLDAFVVGEATGNKALVDVAIQAMDENQNMAIGALKDLSIALLGGPSFSAGAQGASTILGFANTVADLYKTEVESANELPAELAAEVQPMPNVSQEFGTLYGTVDITNPGGIAAAQTGLDLSGGFVGLTTLADPTGSYQILVPLNVAGFDYSNADVEAFDPIDGTYISDETVNIANLSPLISLTLPTFSGACDDDDASDPDSDDPDCD